MDITELRLEGNSLKCLGTHMLYAYCWHVGLFRSAAVYKQAGPFVAGALTCVLSAQKSFVGQTSNIESGFYK